MTGREDQKANDLFFTCSLIDYIARKTKNKRSAVVNALGRTSVSKIYDLADVYHSDNIDTVSDDFIASAHISEGTFDNVTAAKYAIPSHWDIGKRAMPCWQRCIAHDILIWNFNCDLSAFCFRRIF